MPTCPDARRPWLDLPRVPFPVVLADAQLSPDQQAALDALIDWPDGSALTVARIDPATGALRTARWRDTGRTTFYPASTVKLVTGVLLLPFLRRHGLTLDATLALGDEPPGRIGAMLDAMVARSDNDDFSTLQEAVGFAETDAALRSWGVADSMIRRHFRRPRHNSSRPASLVAADGRTIDLPGRPAPDLPLNVDGTETNAFTTDDLVRVLAAAFAGPYRDLPGFDALAGATSRTNERFLGRGADALGVGSYNKPGWWPPDGVNVDAAYLFDPAGGTRGAHYLIGASYQGPPDQIDDAQRDMASGAAALLSALRDGRLAL